ncbi:hypothetical protein GETHPA_20680 [Geothrix rubra]|uniref:HNH nuclease domain-containing protein n=1 Tax=Geothrix rubra TaxID=2927977 RepID=A0ABQ5Q8U5_9BACT|nr:HNH endonuclease [Geothrix rubra]GLH70535.1 hypothetical protein GETHPA_20680 [Geothrix rubra]
MRQIAEKLRALADEVESHEATGDSQTWESFDSFFELPSIVQEIATYLQPILTPYEAAFYWHMFSKCVIENHTQFGVFSTYKFATGVVLPSRSTQTLSVPTSQVSVVLAALEQKGAISKAGEPRRDGTPYRINLPEEISSCIEAMKKAQLTPIEISDPVDERKRLDFYNVKSNRIRVFERDGYKCYKCGKQLTRFDATLDHLIPVSKGGDNSFENLATCCLSCNSKRRNHELSDFMPDQA